MIYQVFNFTGQPPFVVQFRALDGVALAAGDLAAFRAVRELTTPTGTLPMGSVLILAPDSAAKMLQAGTIEAVMEAPEQILRVSAHGQGCPTAEAATEGRKPDVAAIPAGR